MIKSRIKLAHKPDGVPQTIFVFGLTAADLEFMRGGKERLFDATQMGIPGAVCVMYAETEEQIVRWLHELPKGERGLGDPTGAVVGHDVRAIDAQTMWIFLISSLRYAMGRRSYITSLTAELVATHFDMLTPAQREQVIEEIANELDTCERMGQTLGDAMDHELWGKTVERLRGML